MRARARTYTTDYFEWCFSGMIMRGKDTDRQKQLQTRAEWLRAFTFYRKVSYVRYRVLQNRQFVSF